MILGAFFITLVPFFGTRRRHIDSRPRRPGDLILVVPQGPSELQDPLQCLRSCVDAMVRVAPLLPTLTLWTSLRPQGPEHQAPVPALASSRVHHRLLRNRSE